MYDDVAGTAEPEQPLYDDAESAAAAGGGDVDVSYIDQRRGLSDIIIINVANHVPYLINIHVHLQSRVHEIGTSPQWFSQCSSRVTYKSY